MSTTKLILQARATMFIPRFLGYGVSSLKAYKDLLPDSVPCQVQGLMSPYGPVMPDLADNSPWQLSKGNDRIVFLPNRIDYITSSPIDSDDKEKDFLAFSKNVFRSILQKEQVNSTRFAYAPQYALDGDDDFVNCFWNKLLNPNNVAGSIRQDNYVRSNYQIVRMLDDKEIKVNHLIDFGSGLKNTGDENVSIIISNIDINTVDDSFDAHHTHLFFERVLEWKNALMDNYLKIEC